MAKEENKKRGQKTESQRYKADNKIRDILSIMIDIPLPVEDYHVLKCEENNPEFKVKLSRVLSFRAFLYRMIRAQCYNDPFQPDYIIDYTPGLFLGYYDLENPVLDKHKKNYWFGIREELLIKYKVLVRPKNPEKFEMHLR